MSGPSEIDVMLSHLYGPDVSKERESRIQLRLKPLAEPQTVSWNHLDFIGKCTKFNKTSNPDVCTSLGYMHTNSHQAVVVVSDICPSQKDVIDLDISEGMDIDEGPGQTSQKTVISVSSTPAEDAAAIHCEGRDHGKVKGPRGSTGNIRASVVTEAELSSVELAKEGSSGEGPGVDLADLEPIVLDSCLPSSRDMQQLDLVGSTPPTGVQELGGAEEGRKEDHLLITFAESLHRL